mgnify:CR=1 FL=1
MSRELTPDKLYRRCDPASLGFEHTDDLAPLDDIIGQERAVKALELGLGIRDHRYNVYVAGDPGTGKTSTVRAFLERVSGKEDTPPDLCYVRNFKDPYRPLPLHLPPGQGGKLADGVRRLIDALKLSIPAAFESEEYRQRRQQVDEEAVANRAKIFEALEQEAAKRGFALQRTPIGINAIPMHQGKPLTEEQFKQLDEAERQALERPQQENQALVQKAIHEVSALEEARAQQIRQLNQEVAAFLIRPAIAKLKGRYQEHADVFAHLEAVEGDLMKHVDQFFSDEDDEKAPTPPFGGEEPDPFGKYAVNVLVDHGGTRGAPVVVLDNATYPNLFGKVEHRVMMGTLVSDFGLIRAGALHQANGGYLVLNADNLMRNPLSWEGLKVAFKCGEITLEDPAYLTGHSGATETLKPQSVPLDVKVIIVGSHGLFQLIEAYDEEFRKFFNVKCEFSDHIPWKAKFTRQFGPFIRARCQERCLLPFSNTGVARIVEYAGQLVSSQKRLSARFSDIMVIVREAVYWAQQQGAKLVTVEHVERAIEEKHYRSNLVEEVVREMIQEGSILVATRGTAVGQVNGLSVYDLGDLAFGRPVRITANVYMGKDGVVDIENEAELSGKIHTKGSLILRGWFGQTFAMDQPLSLSGSVTFEQSYGPVEGDSASCAELFALISALAEVPVRQGLAVTGSMNQKGEVQPIGGVNEKVEGFFRVCQTKGLTGGQGVVIPAQNARDLMLHRDVVRAVERGAFHVWPIKTVEEGLALMTGQTVGKRTRGNFPAGSIYDKVRQRLAAFNQGLDAEDDR